MKKTLALSLLAFGIVSCSRPYESEGLSTPKGAAYESFSALNRLDEAKLLASVVGSQEELKRLVANIHFLAAIRDLRAAVIREYGNSGWAHFEEEGGAVLTLSVSTDLDALKDLPVEVDGDTATIGDLTLHQRNGAWYSEAEAFFAAGDFDAPSLMELSKLLQTKLAKIGQEGVTAQTLDLEIGKEMTPIALRGRWDILIDREKGISGNPLSWIVKGDYECIVRIEDNGEIVDRQIPTQGPRVDMKIEKKALFVNGADSFDLRAGDGSWVNRAKFQKERWQSLWRRRDTEAGWRAEILVRAWHCVYCEGTRDGNAQVKKGGDLSDCAPGSGCALLAVTDKGEEFSTSCPKCSEEN